jgi:ABC-type phosphate transport system auxiliary subunit
VLSLFQKRERRKLSKTNKLNPQGDSQINRSEIEQKLARLQSDLNGLASEIDEMVSDFQTQPEKYDNLSLQELMHIHSAEVTRINREIDDFENQLVIKKHNLKN